MLKYKLKKIAFVSHFSGLNSCLLIYCNKNLLEYNNSNKVDK